MHARRIVLLLALLVPLLGLGPTPAAGSGDEATGAGRPLFFWTAEAPGGARLHLLGSVAVPDTTRLRFDTTVMEAFAAAERLVLPDDSSLEKQNALIGHKAHLPPEVTLADWLPPEVYAGYAAALARNGDPPGTGDVVMPWLAVRVIRDGDLRRAGFVDEREFELYFAALVRDGFPPRPLQPLEPAAAGYDRLVALPRALQTRWLAWALAASERAPDDLAATADAWRDGDADALAAVGVFAPVADAERARLAGRARAWLADAEPDAVDFWVVDARLLVGETGVVARLRDDGTPVAQRRGREASP